MIKYINTFLIFLLFFFLPQKSIVNAESQSLGFELVGQFGSQVNDIVVKSDTAYVTSYEKIEIYDVSNKQSIVRLGEIYKPGCMPEAIDVIETTAYVTETTFRCSGNLHLIDVTNPENPVDILEEPIVSWNGYEIEVVGTKIYMASAQIGLSIIDIHDPYNPVVYSPFNPHNGFGYRDLDVVGNLVYLANGTGGFYIVDVTDPSNMYTVASVDISIGPLADYHSNGIVYSDGKVYIAGSERHLKIFDVSNINNVTMLYSPAKSDINTTDIDVAGNLAFMTSSRYGIYAYNIADPINPILENIYHTDSGQWRRVVVSDGYIYAVNQLSEVLVLTYDGLEIQSEIEPFLELPWDYLSNGMTFSEAALSINAYFDHEYPLLSAGLRESDQTSDTIISFFGHPRTNEFYTKHDGYDWGSAAKTKNEVPVLASAGGIATYHDECGPCGNAVHIDHRNGFQTRYYHLSPSGLISTDVDAEIDVVQGQKIGEVGFTGNISPSGEAGSHLHFMVIQDKNRDGNFSDNIPDGLVDPFGWQGTDTDPWSIYSFLHHGIQKVGSVSNYLWKHSLSRANESIGESGGEIILGRYGVIFPYYSTDENINLNLEYSSIVNISEEIRSVSPVLNMNARNLVGEKVEHFSEPFLMRFDLSGLDLSAFVPGSLSIFSSSDGENWTEENSVLDTDNMAISANIDHLSLFAVAGELRDTDPPVSTLTTEGSEGVAGHFRSKVNISITAEDTDSEIDTIIYSIDDGGALEYLEPFEVTEEGQHKISYYAEDIDGNVEEAKVYEFSIDKTYPSARFKYDKALNKIITVGTDDQEGVTVEEALQNLNTNILITDKSGNELVVNGVYKRADSKNNLTIKSYQFGTGNMNPVNVNFDGRISNGFTYQTLLDLKKNILYISKYDSSLEMYKVQKKSLNEDDISYHTSETFLYVEVANDNLILGYE